MQRGNCRVSIQDKYIRMEEMTLSVFYFNIGAYRGYQKCGFAEIGRVEGPNRRIGAFL